MTKKTKFTPAEVIAVRDHILTLSYNDLLSKGYIDLTAVLSDITPVPPRYEVVLVSAGDRKIPIIKDLRAHLQLSLQASKKLTDETPSVLVKDATQHDATILAQDLTDHGAKVTIREVVGR